MHITVSFRHQCMSSTAEWHSRVAVAQQSGTVWHKLCEPGCQPGCSRCSGIIWSGCVLKSTHMSIIWEMSISRNHDRGEGDVWLKQHFAIFSCRLDSVHSHACAVSGTCAWLPKQRGRLAQLSNSCPHEWHFVVWKLIYMNWYEIEIKWKF